MQINIENLISITDANQNFSRVARMVDETGAAVILKNNSPRYVVLDYRQLEEIQQTANEHVESVAKKVLANNLDAFRELAK